MNQWLTESEKLIKNEEKIGTEIEVLQEQIKDNQVSSLVLKCFGATSLMRPKKNERKKTIK